MIEKLFTVFFIRSVNFVTLPNVETDYYIVDRSRKAEIMLMPFHGWVKVVIEVARSRAVQYPPGRTVTTVSTCCYGATWYRFILFNCQWNVYSNKCSIHLDKKYCQVAGFWKVWTWKTVNKHEFMNHIIEARPSWWEFQINLIS